MALFDWGKYFDKIFCISLADYKERHEDVKKELERIGVDTDASYFEWKVTVRNYFYKYIWENPNAKIDAWWRNNISALNTTMAHYEILKESQALDYRKILIIEDDVRFLKNIEDVWDTIKNTPEYDICNYGGNPINEHRAHCVELKKNAKGMFYDDSSLNMLGCEFIAFSEKAISDIVSKQENKYQPADWYINAFGGDGSLTRIAPVKQIAIQNSAYRYGESGYSYTMEGNYKDILDLKDFNI